MSAFRKLKGGLEMKKLFAVFVALLMFLSFFHFVLPQNTRCANSKQGNWVNITKGLYGGNVLKIITDYENPQNLYLFTFEKGIFKSNDGGKKWYEVGNEINSAICDIEIDPRDSSIIYAVSRSGSRSTVYIYKSEDKGEHWNRINTTNLVGNYYDYTLLIVPENDLTLYLAINNGSVFRSDDGGENWKEINNGITTKWIYSMAFDPNNTSTLYLGTGGKGVFKSVNKGENWTLIGSKENGLFNPYIMFFAVDPKDSNILYAGTGCGLIKSTNGGKSWVAMSSIPCGGVNFRAFDKINPNNIYLSVHTYPSEYGGLFKSSDKGKTWVNLTNKENGLFDVATIALNSKDPNNIYIGTKKGVLNSLDGGLSWGNMNEGFTSLLIYSAAFSNSVGTIYVLTSSGVYKTENSGLEWLEMNNGLRGEYFYSFAIDSKDSNILYVSTDGGIFKTMDGGNHWDLKVKGLNIDDSIDIITIDPNNSSILYVGTSGGNVYKSVNGGESWISTNMKLANYYIEAVAVDPNNSATIYVSAYTYQTGGKSKLLKSNNAGSSWVEINYGDEFIASYIYDIVVNPKDSNIIYLATYGCGILKSEDGGKSWKKISSNTTLDLEIDPVDMNIIYAAQSVGLYESLNGGLDWVNIGYYKGIYNFVKSFYLGNFTYLISSVGINYSAGGDLFIYLQVPDTPSLISPLNNAYLGTLTPTLSWSSIADADSYRIQISDSITFENLIVNKTVTDTSFVIPTGTLSNGKTYYWWVSALKGIASSNWSEIRKLNVFEDSNGPALTITSPSNNQIFDSPNITVRGSTTDSESGIEKVAINGNTVSFSSDGSFSKVINLTEGSNTITIIAIDKVGNQTTKTLNVTYKKLVQATVIILQIGNTNFTVNGISNTLDSPPVIKNNRTLLPIRAVIESLGGVVAWDAAEKKVTITLGSNTIELWIGKNTARVNGVDTPIDATNAKVVPEIINSRTMLPLRFVTENLGCDVQWDGTTQTITIKYPKP